MPENEDMMERRLAVSSPLSSPISIPTSPPQILDDLLDFGKEETDERANQFQMESEPLQVR